MAKYDSIPDPRPLPPIKVADDGTLYIQPKNEIFRIKEIWAFLSVDPNNDAEGIISMPTDFGQVPMIAADAARLTSLIPRVERIVQSTGVTARLVKFTTREEVRVIKAKK